MAKDPAFLFYPGDWLGGTMGMTMEQKGAYMELLIFQFNNGPFTEAQAEHVLSICFASVWQVVSKKFTKVDSLYYNIRLRDEIDKRRKFSESRRNNAKGNKSTLKVKKHMLSTCLAHAEHMEDENENENENVIKVKKIDRLSNIQKADTEREQIIHGDPQDPDAKHRLIIVKPDSPIKAPIHKIYGVAGMEKYYNTEGLRELPDDKKKLVGEFMYRKDKHYQDFNHVVNAFNQWIAKNL